MKLGYVTSQLVLYHQIAEIKLSKKRPQTLITQLAVFKLDLIERVLREIILHV